MNPTFTFVKCITTGIPLFVILQFTPSSLLSQDPINPKIPVDTNYYYY